MEGVRQSVQIIAVLLCTALILPVASENCPVTQANSVRCLNLVDTNVEVAVDNCYYTLTNVNKGSCTNNVTLISDCDKVRQCDSTYFEGPAANQGLEHVTCVPSSVQTVTGTQSATLSTNSANGGSCEQTRVINYKFLSITSCKCGAFNYVT